MTGPFNPPIPGTATDDRLYRSMLESAPAYFYLASPVDFSTLYRSPQAEPMLGYSLEEWRTNPDLWISILHADDRERVTTELAQVGRGGSFQCEYRLLTKSGELRWVRDHAALVKHPAGEGMIVQGVVLDITDQVLAREAVERVRKESEAQARFFDGVFDTAPLGVAKIDPEMRVMAANGRLLQMLQAGPGDLVGTSVSGFLEPLEVERMRRQFRPPDEVQATRAEGTSVAHRADGNDIWILWSATSARLDDSGIAHVLILFEDISAKHDAEALAEANLAGLERLSRLKSEFISVVSHEFRTALTGIQGFSELMRDLELTREEVREYASDIHADALRLNRMISDMLDLDRIESGRMRITLTPVDVNEVLRESVKRAASSSSIHQFSTDLEPALPAIAGDRDRLFQVVSNLLTNAVKYSPRGGEIAVTSRRDAAGILVSVRDHGLGIPAAFLERVFERYERYENGGSDRITGTGLGLPIAREIVELHGGSIAVDSVEGEGSTFRFHLPLRDEAAMAV